MLERWIISRIVDKERRETLNVEGVLSIYKTRINTQKIITHIYIPHTSKHVIEREREKKRDNNNFAFLVHSDLK